MSVNGTTISNSGYDGIGRTTRVRSTLIGNTIMATISASAPNSGHRPGGGETTITGSCAPATGDLPAERELDSANHVFGNHGSGTLLDAIVFHARPRASFSRDQPHQQPTDHQLGYVLDGDFGMGRT